MFPAKVNFTETPGIYFDIASIPNPIKFDPNAGPTDVLCFKHYNANEVVMGKTMADWMRFSVCYWHTFTGSGGSDPFGSATLFRPWDDGSNSVENAENRLRVAFDFFKRLGVKFYTFHDRDISPEGRTFQETCENLERILTLALQLQEETGIKPLWVTCNLFTHPRYANGAATNPDPNVFAYAAAQVRVGLAAAKRLGAENFVFWGGREGYNSLLNTNVRQELDQMARFFRMAIAYKEEINFTGQFLIEPKPKEPTKHQYDYDAMTVIAFLQHYKLTDHFKLNIEPNHTTLAGHDYTHDLVVASAFKMLGSIDANTGSPDLGWDTDQFPMDIRNTTLLMKIVIEQGGIQPGGLNFDAKVRRESVDMRDLFVAHIGAMDALARGLKNAAKIIEDGILANLVQERYIGYGFDIGKSIMDGKATLKDCEAFILKNGEKKPVSGKQETFEAILNFYLK